MIVTNVPGTPNLDVTLLGPDVVEGGSIQVDLGSDGICLLPYPMPVDQIAVRIADTPSGPVALLWAAEAATARLIVPLKKKGRVAIQCWRARLPFHSLAIVGEQERCLPCKPQDGR